MAAGCLSARPPDQLWVDQRAGLMAVPDPARRATMLCAVTESAAAAGDAAAVKMLLADLADDPRHDDLAVRCAAAVAAKNKHDGRRVAALVRDADKRQVALDKVNAVEPAGAK